MGWLSRRSAGTRALEEAMAERVQRLARQWSPVPSSEATQPSPGASSPGASSPGASSPSQSASARVDAWHEVIDRERPAPCRGAGPWTGPAVRALALLVAACLAATAWWWWSGRPRPVVTVPDAVASGRPLLVASPTISAAPGPTPSGDVVVHVTGLVVQPGLVTLPAGSRVSDAVAAAGGVTKATAADTVNLARVVVDGEQIVVGGAPVAATSGPAVVDLNSADAAAFEGLPGVGPVLAGRILAWRAANGPFRSIDELREVSGIGEATLARLQSLVRV